MARQVEALLPVVDQFSVFADDGFSKVPGLGAAAFDVTAYRNGALVAARVDIAEIAGSPGEYRLTFTPDAEGFWQIDVAYAAGRQIYSEQYDVKLPLVVGGIRPPGGG